MKARRVRNVITTFLISVTMVIACVPQVCAADGLKEGQAVWTQEASTVSSDKAGTAAKEAAASQNTTEDETRNAQAVTDSDSQDQSAFPNTDTPGTASGTDAVNTSGTTAGKDAVNTSGTTSGTDMAKTPDAADGKNAGADPADASKDEKETSEEPTYPEQSWQENVDGTGITISAPEGAFPEETKVSVTAVDSDKVLAAIRKAADEKKIQSEDIKAFNFEFYQGDTHHVEPKKGIQVSFQNVSIAKEDTVLAYHLDSADAAAEKVALSNIDEKGDSVALTASAFSIYAIVSTPAADTDGKIWIGDDDTTTYATINEAVVAAASGATVHIKGKFSENGNAATGATISKNITLDVAGDTTMTGNGSANGITLTSGTKMQTSSGSTLTMSNFGTALTVNNGAEINDGTYVFRNNQSTTRGIYIDGSVRGSSGRESVKITANDKAETNFYSGNATFQNATLDVTSQTWTWKDAVKLNMNNVSMTLSGFGQGFYVDGESSIVNSYLNMKKPGLRWGVIPWGSTGMTFQNGASTVTGSTIRVDYGSNAGISIGLGNANTTMTFEDSTLDFQNGGGSGSSGGAGGLNVNNGNVILSNTTIRGNGDNSGALFGAQTNGMVTLTNNSLVETPASNNPDNGLGQTGWNYVVTGGSHLIHYTDTYFNSASTPKPAIPTNGTSNGNEKLDYVTLADPSVNTVTVLNRQGSYYNYAVGKASSDGKKHIWAPTNTVTFKVDPATEQFEDGSTTDKKFAAVRGNTLDLALSVQCSSNDVITNSASFPETPTNTDSSKAFKGWYIEGTNTKFDPSMQVTEDITVVPGWAGVENISQLDMPLYGDILVGDNTEHDAPMGVNAGDCLTFTGRLNVVSIKDKIKAMKQNFENQGGNAAGIRTENIKSTFIAKLTFPGELTVPENPTAALTDNDLFEITDVTKSGSTVTVTMKLKTDYTMFTDLYTDVTNVADILNVDIPGIKVADTVQDAEQYTVKGEVSGTFIGKATTGSGNYIQEYNFSWIGVQTQDGRDAVQDPTEDPDGIQFTVKVMSLATPGTPDDDKPPVTPDQTKTTPARPNIKKAMQITIYKTAGIVPKTGDNSNLALWFVLMMASCLGIVGIVYKVRRNRKETK